MKKGKMVTTDDIELALDDCLQQLGSGKMSLGQCLARYPQYAAELRPLLEAALQFQQTKAVRPSGAMRDRVRAELAEHVKTHPRPRRKGGAIPKPAVALLLLALAVLFTSTAFAQAALPGQTLYSWKLTMERAWRAAASNPVNADLDLANRRTKELITLASNHNKQVSEATSSADAESQGIAAYTDVLDRLATEADGPDSDHILTVLQEHQTALAHAGIHVSKLDDLCSLAQAHSKGHGKEPKGQP